MLLNPERTKLCPRAFRRALAAAPRAVRGALPTGAWLTIALVASLSLGLGPAAARQQEVPPPPPLPRLDAPAAVNNEPATAREATAAADAPAAAAPPRVRRAADEGEDVPIPPKVLDDRARIEPTVEIRRDEEDNIIEEYMLEGRVYMVKVTPKGGVPYYYIDDDGDGQLELSESARSRGEGPVKPAYWKIKEW